MAKQTIKLKNDKEKTLKNALNEYVIDCKARGLSTYTIGNYTKAINYLIDYVGDINIYTISNGLIKNWAIHLLETKSSNSCRTLLKGVRLFLNYFNLNIDITLPPKEKKVLPIYTDEEIKKLLTKSKRMSFGRIRTYTIVCFLLNTGVRTQTLINIKIKDIDFNSNKIFLAKTKTHKQYEIPMSTALKKQLKEYLELWEHNDDNYLFPNIYGEQLSADALRQRIMEYHLARGVKTYSIHKYRRTFATNFSKNNNNMFMLQLLMGHSDISTTRLYCNTLSVDDIANYDSYCILDRIKKNTIKVNKTSISSKKQNNK